MKPDAHLDTRVGGPTKARWSGGPRPEITPARAAAIADKRRWQAAVASGELVGFASGAELAAGAVISPHAVALAVPEAAELRPEPLRVLAWFVGLVLAGFRGALAMHPELAARTLLSERTARRAMDTVLHVPLVTLVTPLFEPHGAATSRRGNAYAPHPTLLGGIASLAKFGQASGTDLQSSPVRAISGEILERSSGCLARPGTVVSATRTVVPDLAPVPDAAASLTGRATHVVTRHASPEAPDGDRFAMLTAELEAAGLADMAAECRRTRARKAAGLAMTLGDLERQRELERRSEIIGTGELTREEKRFGGGS